MPVTQPQLFIAIGLPLLVPALTLGTNIALFLHLSGRLDRLSDRMDTRFERVDTRFETLITKFVDLDNRVSRIGDKLGIVPR